MTNKKHSCSNTEEYIDYPEGPICACGKRLSKKLRKEIDACWEKGKKERLIESIKELEELHDGDAVAMGVDKMEVLKLIHKHLD